MTASPARATDDLDGYQGEEKKNVSVESDRDYDAPNNRTTFTFILKTNGENVSHVLLIACQGVDLVSATGPAGADKVDGDTPQADKSVEGDHVGVKFQPGVPGTYTIVFAGDIAGAEFVVKDGTGHKHYPSGSASDVCKTVTAQPPSTPQENPPGENPPANNPPANNPPADNPPANPASNQPSQTGTEVQGATVTNNAPAGLSTDVLGAQQSQPEALAALPRTGSDLGLLAPLGAMLVAFGSVAIAAGRRG